MLRRMVAAGLASAGLTVGVVGITSTSSVAPAAAQTAPAPVEFSGNFRGGQADEWFSYQPGTGADWLYSLGNGGVPGGNLTINRTRETVNGTYRAVAGNFDGTGFDEIFWYGPGSTDDQMWFFSDMFRTSRPYSIGGDYQPLVGDFTGDGVDDIYFYAPGLTADLLWEFNTGGGNTVVTINNNGTYRPVVASIGKDATDDIVWYTPPPSCGAAPTAPTVLWDFTVGTTTYTSETLSVPGGDLDPFGFDQRGQGWRGQDLFWYAPTATASPVWDYNQGVRSDRLEPLTGVYEPVVGDFLGDGQDDILWTTSTQLVLWDHNGSNRWPYDRPRQP